ncbi:VanZ family protein [Neolewinella lacunae]|uniref:VanZ family protein n=1 Tax=Neolewinella lacunae TaxID=1517758 RepID=A0A923T981_9BACT|nr:VanZ family protein [Neolewinella lacunae]MBC6996445.1 VanZ family protein [Neolewinella lacunae]MDN3633612.1 VanZ family protein [Neolewinella lacunae]
MPGHPPKQKREASSPQTRRIQRFAAAAYACFVLVISLLPGAALPVVPDWNLLFSPDKIAHFGVYAIFALLLSAIFTERRKLWGLIAAIGLAGTFGGLMEVLQGTVTAGRSFDPVDMVANLLGAAFGGICYLVLQRITTSPSTPVEDNN